MNASLIIIILTASLRQTDRTLNRKVAFPRMLSSLPLSESHLCNIERHGPARAKLPVPGVSWVRGRGQRKMSVAASLTGRLHRSNHLDVCMEATPKPAREVALSVPRLTTAEVRGVILKLTTFGPTFKVTCHSEDLLTELGTLEGFTAPPFKLLHLDSIRIYNSRIQGPTRARMQSPFGLGLLLGAVAVLHGSACGCTKAELLAVDDQNGCRPAPILAPQLLHHLGRLGALDPPAAASPSALLPADIFCARFDGRYEDRLVRFYQRMGFEVVAQVGGNGLSDVPHLLVWGAEGMRMDANIDSLIERWTRALRSYTVTDKEGREAS